MKHRLLWWVMALFSATFAMQAQTKPLPLNHGQVVTQLYLSPDGQSVAAGAERRPLLVAMGGAEGGNPWAGARAQPMRNAFLADGYAFAALGYFGAPGTPAQLDRIAIDAVRSAIASLARNPAVDGRCIALIGGSKGAELALLLASRSPEIKAVAAVVPASVVFVGHTDQFDTSSFSDAGQEIAFVPMTEEAVPALIAGDKRKVFDLMMRDTHAVERARIPVEQINGPVFLLSATQDEMWASREMSDQIMARLRETGFVHPFEHVAIEGDHGAPMRHLQQVRQFLNTHFLPQRSDGCARTLRR